MKKIFSLVSLVVMTAMMTISCQEIQSGDHLKSAEVQVLGGEYNKSAGTTRRAFFIFHMENFNDKPYTIDYKIDGNAGTGKYALEYLSYDLGCNLSVSQNFTGSGPLKESMYSDEYDGNFPSGSSTHPVYLNGKNLLRLPSRTSAHFLSPKLEAGKHTIEFKVTDSYGDTVTGIKEFEIEGEEN